MKFFIPAGLLVLSLFSVAAPRQSFADEHETQLVVVSLKEWDIGFHKIDVTREKVRFDIKNDGNVRHAFELEGEVGGKEFEIATPLLDPGRSTTIIVELPEGEYEVYCPVPGHEERGMKGEVEIGGGSY